MSGEIDQIRSSVDEAMTILADATRKLDALDQRMNVLDEQEYSPSAAAEISALRLEVLTLQKENTLLAEQVATRDESLAHAIAMQDTLRLAARNLQKQR